MVKAEDETVLEGVKLALNNGLIFAYLVGEKKTIEERGKKVNFDLKQAEIIDIPEEQEALRL